MVAELYQKQVLLISINETIANALEGALLYWQTRPTTVLSLHDAQHKLKPSQRFDYVLIDVPAASCDLFHPIVDQMAALEGSPVVITMLSSMSRREFANLQSLPSKYLNKPVLQPELLEAMVMSNDYTGHFLGRYTRLGGQVGHKDGNESLAPHGAPIPGKVLLAEDNPNNQRVALRILEKMGHTVTLAENGVQAVLAAQQQKFASLLSSHTPPLSSPLNSSHSPPLSSHSSPLSSPLTPLSLPSPPLSLLSPLLSSPSQTALTHPPPRQL